MTLAAVDARPDLRVDMSEDPADIRHRALRALLAYWTERCPGPDRLPSRADIDPVGMKAFLPHVMLVDVTGKPARFRWRLLGTATIGWLHRDMTGRWFDEIYAGPVLESMYGMYRTTVTTRRPARFTGRASFASKDYVTFETLHLPLSAPGDPDGPVRMILGGAVLQIPDRAR
ncbi:MAG: PAS domain-containing protein [Pseudomonadota bacterium]|nr:PAS domain-containing protein [Pseudomonadota bacterium]